MSRPDISYNIVRLSDYNASPTPSNFYSLNYLLCYMYHHPHLPIMYRYSTHDTTLQSYTIKDHVKILDPEKDLGLMVYTDTNFARDLNSRHSDSSNITEYKGTVIVWGSHKQTVSGTCTNITETTLIYKGIKKILEIRRFLESMNDRASGPTPNMEDNQAMIIKIKKNLLTSRIRQLNIILTWSYYQYIRGTVLPFYIDTKKSEGGMNTKPHSAETLITICLSIIGFKFYPPFTSKHYILLDLHKYNMSFYRGLFLLPTKGPSPPSPLHPTNIQSLPAQL